MPLCSGTRMGKRWRRVTSWYWRTKDPITAWCCLPPSPLTGASFSASPEMSAPTSPLLSQVGAHGTGEALPALASLFLLITRLPTASTLRFSHCRKCIVINAGHREALPSILLKTRAKAVVPRGRV